MAKKKDHIMKALNLPEELVELVQTIADDQHRTFTAQAIVLLEVGAKDAIARASV